MPRAKWPDPIDRAFFDAWIDEAEMPDEMRDERVDAFAWTFDDASLTEEHLQPTERRLGFALPTLLWAIYTRVANGGFGPGYGLYSLEMLVNSYGRGAGRLVDFHLFEKQAADKKLIFMPHDVWPEGFLCLCHWGCINFSYLEMATGRVFRQDYYVGEQYGFEVEAPTFEAWFEGWLAEDVDLFSKPRYGGSIMRLQE